MCPASVVREPDPLRHDAVLGEGVLGSEERGREVVVPARNQNFQVLVPAHGAPEVGDDVHESAAVRRPLGEEPVPVRRSFAARGHVGAIHRHPEVVFHVSVDGGGVAASESNRSRGRTRSSRRPRRARRRRSGHRAGPPPPLVAEELLEEAGDRNPQVRLVEIVLVEAGVPGKPVQDFLPLAFRKTVSRNEREGVVTAGKLAHLVEEWSDLLRPVLDLPVIPGGRGVGGKERDVPHACRLPRTGSSGSRARPRSG